MTVTDEIRREFRILRWMMAASIVMNMVILLKM